MTYKEKIESLISELSKLDCRDNSCLFAKDKKGARTNGGCRCLTGLKLGVRIAIEKIWYDSKGKSNGKD